MGYVYKITNQINGKIYIGMSESDNIESRWKEHLSNYRTAWKRTKRPLYEAMNKYGVENFVYEIIEKTDNPIIREQYWIKELNTYIGFKNCNGYNATLGGESRKTAFSKQEDVDKLIALYKDGFTCKNISKILGYDEITISKKLNELGYHFKNYRKGFKICQIDKNTNELINVFESARAAGRYLGNESMNVHISNVLIGKRKTAYGYKWMYYEDYLLNNKAIIQQDDDRCSKIVCVNNQIVFNSIKDAMIWCGQKNNSGIINCCTGKYKTSGKHPETGEPLHWMYYKEYVEKFGEVVKTA